MKDWFYDKYWSFVVRPTLAKASHGSLKDVEQWHLQWEVASSTFKHHRKGMPLREAIVNALCDWDL